MVVIQRLYFAYEKGFSFVFAYWVAGVGSVAYPSNKANVFGGNRTSFAFHRTQKKRRVLKS